jgi:hypothetical protein
MRDQITMQASPYPSAFERAGALTVSIGFARNVLCSIDTAVTVTVVDASGRSVSAEGNPYRTRLSIAATDYSNSGIGFSLVWANWCGPGGEFGLRIQVAGSTKAVPLTGSPPPPCSDTGKPSTVHPQ